jgi:hypothetical protein
MGRMIHPKARVHCPSFYVWNVSHKYGPVGRLQDKYASRMRRMRRCRRPSPEMLHVPGYDGGQVRLPPPSLASIPPPPSRRSPRATSRASRRIFSSDAVRAAEGGAGVEQEDPLQVVDFRPQAEEAPTLILPRRRRRKSKRGPRGRSRQI